MTSEDSDDGEKSAQVDEDGKKIESEPSSKSLGEDKLTSPEKAKMREMKKAAENFNVKKPFISKRAVMGKDV